MMHKRAAAMLLAMLLLLTVFPAGASGTAPKAPQGLTAVYQNGQATIRWQAVAGVKQYEVERSINAGSWAYTGASYGSSFIAHAVVGDDIHQFRVRAVSSGGQKSAYSAVITVSANFNRITPSFTDAVFTDGKILLNWGAVGGADRFRLLRSIDSGPLSMLSPRGNSYTDNDVSAGHTYTYRVQAYSGSVMSQLSSPVTVKAEETLAAPVISKAEYTDGAVKLTWGAVPRATQYFVQRSADGYSWSPLDQLSGTYMIDKSANPGMVYMYRVYAEHRGSKSPMSLEVQIATGENQTRPFLQPIGNTKGMAYLSWSAVEGAAKYQVDRSLNRLVWTRIKVVEGTRTTDLGLVEGSQYFYRVRAVAAGKLNQFSNVQSFTAAAQEVPLLWEASLEDGKVTLSWDDLPGYQRYRVRRKTQDGDWVGLKSVKDEFTYTDSDIQENQSYLYSVQGRSDTGSSGLSNLVHVWVGSLFPPPKLLSAQPNAGWVTLDWEAVPGAVEYRVRRRNPNGEWVALGIVKETGYVDEAVDPNEAYKYVINAYDQDGKNSGNSNVMAVKLGFFLRTPILQKAEYKDGQVALSWESVRGVETYRVGRRVEGGEWVELETVSGTSFSDTTIEPNKNYEFSVKASSNEETSEISNLVSVRTGDFVMAPVLSSAQFINGYVWLVWDEEAGAEAYLVRRRSGGGDWSEPFRTELSEFHDMDLQSNQRYEYSVSVLKDGKESHPSKTRTVNIGLVLDKPVIAVNELIKGQVRLVWGTVPQAESYLVWRGLGEDANSFESFEVETREFLDATVSPGQTYVYLVQAIAGESSSLVSDAILQPVVSSLPAPVLQTAELRDGKVYLKWEEVPLASLYRIKRYDSDGDMVGIGWFAATEYTDESMALNEEYDYRVQARVGDVLSPNSNKIPVLLLNELGTPVIREGIIQNGAVSLSWEPVHLAGEYLVFRAEAGGLPGEPYRVTETVFVDNNVDPGKAYRYTVQAVRGQVRSAPSREFEVAAQGTAAGEANHAGSLPAPKLLAARFNEGKVSLFWEPVSGAGEYAVFRSLDGIQWSPLGTSTGRYMEDATTQAGATYFYRLQASAGGKVSAFSNVQSADTFEVLRAPLLKATVVPGSGIRLEWDSIPGAAEYLIRRYPGLGAYDAEYRTATTAYLDQDVRPGASLRYMVLAVNVSQQSEPSQFIMVTYRDTP